MESSRRRFLSNTIKTVGVLGVLEAQIEQAFAKGSLEDLGLRASTPDSALAILQILTTRTSAQFVVLNEAKKKYGYQVLDANGKAISFQITRRETRSHSEWGVEKLFVTGLSLLQDYRLQVIDSQNGQLIDERIFQSLDTESASGKFVVASCMKDNSSKRESMWNSVARVAPQMVFLVGDTCYADNDNDGSKEGFWRRYVETRSRLSHFRQKRLIPTLAVWDDHDFGGNNMDSTNPLKDEMRELFQIFWESEVTDGLIQGPGVSKVFSAFGQRFFMMDSRSFRSPKESANPSMWGAAQEEFLFTELARNAKPAWLMNGSQFFGGYLKKDAFEYGMGQNLAQICAELSKIEAPVVFSSGDVHFSEFMNIEAKLLGYPTYEITSSSIHSTTIFFNHLREQNDRRIDATSSHNFALIDSAVAGKNWDIHAQCLNKRSEVLIEANLPIRRG